MLRIGLVALLALCACGDDDNNKKKASDAGSAPVVMLDAAVAQVDASKPAPASMDSGVLQCVPPIDHPCLNCAAQRCCVEATRCSNNSECANLTRCIARCGSQGAQCQQACVTQVSKPSSDLLLEYLGCERKLCPSECASSLGDGGV